MQRHARTQRDNENGSAEDMTPDDCQEQDIRFTDVPSQRSRPGSKVKKSSGPVDVIQTETGKKPYKSIDPEEIVSNLHFHDMLQSYKNKKIAGIS